MIRPPRSGRIAISQRLALSLMGLSLMASCTSTTAQTHSSPTPPPTILTAPPTATPEASPTPDPTHVFVIVLENRSYSQVIGMSYIAELAQAYGVAANYHGVSHPSLPNYLAMTSGSTWGIYDDGWHSLPAGGLGSQLTSAGIEWRAYMEGMSSGCFRNGNGYALKHNPFPYYGGACPAEVVPFTQFAGDMAGNVPRFVWITPDLCHDGHDCSNSAVNTWLAQYVPVILGTRAWQNNGVLFITWDEGEDSANSVLTLVVHEDPLIHESQKGYDHYSLLATIEDALGLPRLGQAAQASAMTDLMAVTPVPKLRHRP